MSGTYKEPTYYEGDSGAETWAMFGSPKLCSWCNGSEGSRGVRGWARFLGGDGSNGRAPCSPSLLLKELLEPAAELTAAEEIGVAEGGAPPPGKATYARLLRGRTPAQRK